MIEFYTRKIGGASSKAIALFMLLFCFCSWVNAEVVPENDLGKLQLNQTYTINADAVAYGTFTPEKSGWLRIDANSANTLLPYKEWLGSYDASVTNATDNALSFTKLDLNDRTKFCYEMQVEAGVTYCFAGKNNGMSENGTQCVLSMDKERSLVCYGPGKAEGSVVSPVAASQLSFSFNRRTKYASAELTANGNTVSLSGRNADYAILVSIKDALVDMGNKGLIKTGDKFTIIIKGVRSETDEFTLGYDLEATYELGALPTSLIGSTHTDGTLLTWYEPGDPEGMIILEFSKAIKSANAQINYGISGRGSEDAAFVRLSLTPIIDGNKVILDMTGVRRLPTDLIQADGVDFTDDAFKKISIGITGIRDIDGIGTYPSTKWMTFDFVTPTTDVACDFSPVDGSNIDNVDNITIWIQDENKLKYSGVDFTYEENGEKKTVTVTDLKKEDDADVEGAKNVTVAIPAEVKGKGDITVTLHDLSCIDGKDYSADIRADYKSLVATGIQNIQMQTPASHVMYNLNGIKVNANAKSLKGVYIINGKKVVK